MLIGAFIQQQVFKEAILWAQLCHSNVLAMYGLYLLDDQICLVSPWMQEGDLTIYLETHPDAPRLPLVSHFLAHIGSGLTGLSRWVV